MKLTKGQIRLLRRIDSHGKKAINGHYCVAEKLEKKSLIHFGVHFAFTTESGEAELKKEGRRR